MAVDFRSEQNRDLYIWDLERESMNRLTDHATEDFFPVWSRDGHRVFFTSSRSGPLNIFSRSADGAGQAERLIESPTVLMPLASTPDGARLLGIEQKVGATGFDIIGLEVEHPVEIEPLVATEHSETSPTVSPDGNWLAYLSNASGQFEVYVRPLRNPESQRWKISIDGGVHPTWNSEGDEIFYRNLGGDMMVAAVALTPGFEVGGVTDVFPGSNYRFAGALGGRMYDVSPVDGRFLMIKPVEQQATAATSITVILNWFEELTRLVPTP